MDDNGEMELVAFGFDDATEAEAAERELRQLLDVDERDLATAPLAGSPDFVNGYTATLAGRIRKARVAAAIAVVAVYGGKLLTDLPESWLVPGR